MPLAPPLFSMTTGTLASVLSACPTMRASWSVPLPAPKGTTMVMGLLG